MNHLAPFIALIVVYSSSALLAVTIARHTSPVSDVDVDANRNRGLYDDMDEFSLSDKDNMSIVWGEEVSDSSTDTAEEINAEENGALLDHIRRQADAAAGDEVWPAAPLPVSPSFLKFVTRKSRKDDKEVVSPEHTLNSDISTKAKAEENGALLGHIRRQEDAAGDEVWPAAPLPVSTSFLRATARISHDDDKQDNDDKQEVAAATE